ncbi:unnamed protein product [Mytilus edulis]|uniref:Uncharacterized protein n=1 Tax=Mytilus edulis TaxID=6550 RepID=A0A8S3V9E8_MYTED|nr:unnamed protein product [Mytilus edulis]
MNNHNSTEGMPCEIHTQQFNVVSYSGSNMNEVNVTLFMAKYTNTIANVSSLYFKKVQLKKLPFIQYASLNNNGIHVFDFSENFLEAFYGLEIITVFNSFTLNLGNNEINKYEKVTFKTDNNRYFRSYHIDLKYKHNSIFRVNDSLLFIEIGHSLSFIYISIDLSFNRLHSFDLTSVITSSDSDSYLIVKTLNVSHNDMEVYRNCPKIRLYIQLLDLTYNKLRELPDSSCHYATETYLGHNSITGIRKTLPTVSISNLDLEWNLIQYIFNDAFENMTSITTLNLRGNKLETFPKAVQNLLYLRTLDISYNIIINIKQSDIVGKMNYLTSLILTGNDLDIVPSTSNSLLRPVPDLDLKDNLISCDCDVKFLRNSTLNTQGRCSFPPEFEGYLVSCFPLNNCIGKSSHLYLQRNQT